MKPTISTGPAREPGAHGITLQMRYMQRPEPDVVHVAAIYDKKGFRRRGDGTTYVNPDKDRSQHGKARRRARKAARGLARRPFFKGHGVASENAYNLRYECPCGRGMYAPLDDPDFMTDVMEHEAEHAEAVSA